MTNTQSPKRQSYEINFVYDTPNEGDTHDSATDTCVKSICDISPVTAVLNSTNISAAQRSCTDTKDMIDYLETGALSDNNGNEHPTCFGGRGLRRSEQNWTVSELEALAIVEGTRAYHPYLIAQPFTIVTDHVSLTYLNSLKGGKSRLQRWALHLQAYSFTIRHKAGRLLTNANSLSRREYPTPPEKDDDLLDDSAYLSAIDSNPFDCTVNDKHSQSPKQQLYEINFVYDTPNEGNTHDSPTDTCVKSICDISPVTAVLDSTNISAAQCLCPDTKDMIDYLESGALPDNDIAARRIVFDSEQYTLINDTLYHLYTPRHKTKTRSNLL